MVEAHRGDLVGEHLGSTAIKTNKLIDSALGGVLFIDEAYSLTTRVFRRRRIRHGSDADLLKRAEDDRDRLVIVLAGYPLAWNRFLAPTRASPPVQHEGHFPSYTARELTRHRDASGRSGGR